MAPVDLLDASMYLDAYRCTIATSLHAKRSNLALVRARLAAGEVIDDAFAPGPAANRAHSRRAAAWLAVVKPVALSVGIATAGVGAVKTAALTWQALVPDAQRDATAEGMEPETASKLRSGTLRRDPHSAVVAPELAAAVPREVGAVTMAVPHPAEVRVSAPPHPRKRPDPVSDPASVPPTAPPVDDRLQRETALMLVARDQLSAEQWEALIATLARHATQFPEGSMKPERKAWEAISRCGLRDARGTSAGEAFITRYPRSALADKVRRACGLAPK
ncbi:MAG: hypothetical protein JKY37_16400 [Nannocystaceae bacterium]|nr:hypothetical protein [Nannocystaceae bacterium]